jgi:argininosuccinate lyase
MLPNLVSHRSAKFSEMLPAFHRFDKAHTVSLTEEGLIDHAAGRAILLALRDMERRGVAAVRMEVDGGMHSGEQYLIRTLGHDPGGRIHLGRSSGDLQDVGLRITARGYLLDIMAAINTFRAAILDLVPDHVDTVMPGYTHGQHAQPTTYGHWLAMWAHLLARDFDRLQALYRRVNRSPAGAAILTGSDFPLNRHRTSVLLGFDSPLPSTIDAIMSHDVELEFTSVCAIHANGMARLADDFMLWFSAEFGMIDVPDRFCGSSSIMMQKKNPSTPAETKGVAAEAVAAGSLANDIFKGPTGLSIVERKYLEKAMWSVAGNIVRDLEWWTDLLVATEVKTEVMRERAGAHWAQATDLAGALVRERDLPWRAAHQIVGILIRHAYERGMTPTETTPEMLDEAAVEYQGEPVQLPAHAFTQALDASTGPARRSLYGGPGPDAIHQELTALGTQLAGDQDRLAELVVHMARSDAALERAIDEIVA